MEWRNGAGLRGWDGLVELPRRRTREGDELPGEGVELPRRTLANLPAAQPSTWKSLCLVNCLILQNARFPPLPAAPTHLAYSCKVCHFHPFCRNAIYSREDSETTK